MNMEQSLLHMNDMFVADKEGEWMTGQSVFITFKNRR